MTPSRILLNPLSRSRRRSYRLRNGSRLAAALLAATLLTPAVATARQAAPEIGFEDLAEGVFVAVQTAARRFNESTALVVVGERGALVVDAQTDPRMVRATIAEIKRRTELPVRWVVSTHFHGDHTQGNWIYRETFGEQVAFLGHRSLIADVHERAAADHQKRVDTITTELPMARDLLARGVDEEGAALDQAGKEQMAQAIERAAAWLERNQQVTWIAPTFAYDSSLVLDLGGRSVELRHFRAHTRGDTVVYLPAEKILATGDLLDDLPYVGHGYPRSWRATLEEIAALPVEVFVPGHGTPYRDRGQLERVSAFVAALVDGVEAAVAKGTTREDLATGIDLTLHRTALAGDDPVAGRFFDGVLKEALERTYDDVTGALVD